MVDSVDGESAPHNRRYVGLDDLCVIDEVAAASSS